MKNTTKLLISLLGLAMTAFTYAQMPYPYTPYPGCPIPCEPCNACCEPLSDLYNYCVQFGTAGCQTQRLIFSGLIQTEYQFIHVNDKAPTIPGVNVNKPADTNNFLMRRVRLGFEADLGECWKGVIIMDFAGKETQPRLAALDTSTVITTENKHGIFGLYNAYIEKYYCNVYLRAGYKKVNFIYEENIEDRDLKTIERSIATNFFNQSMIVQPFSGGGLGFGERHVGIFIDAFYKGFSIGGALVNGYQGTNIASDKTNNELGYFGYASYETTCNCVDIEIGCNIGFKPKGNNLTLSVLTGQPRGSIFGWNPYAVFNWNCFYLMGEIVGAKVEKGGVDGITDVSPIGANLIFSYTWTCFEFVGRLSYLNTDHRGTSLSTVIPCCSDTADVLATGDIYNKGFTAYGGINYYMLNGAIKFSAGYEYARFSERHSGLLLNPNRFSVNGFTQPNGPFSNAKSYIHSARAQLQLVF